MTFDEFRASLTADTPPPGLAPPLEALWWEGRGDWRRAHETAQDDASTAAAWVHAFLHRKEGDLGNAGYWYRRAGRPVARVPLEDEWKAIVTELLG